MKNFFLTIFVTVLVITCNAQTSCGIKKAYAFYTSSMPGMQMADENGNPIQPKPIINRFIYIEWTGAKNPEVITVLYNKKPLTASITKAENNSVTAGTDNNNNSKEITAKKCNSLWRLDLQTADGIEMPETDCKNIIIKLKATGKTCELKLTKEIQLQTRPSY